MMYTYHPVDEPEKVEMLAKSMEQDGWVGAPIVKWGEEYLLTGCHRYNAAKSLGWDDSEIPMIDLEDVFAEDDKDFTEYHEKHDEPTIDETYGLCCLLDELSDEIRQKYGIDIQY
jgi:hypothetical protein